ncbi:unnamed protein product [Brassica rapa]|uniref:Era-type G domain-containing protein n=1 Tax=Brassica campestris TaxID=3711 RepID=A0A8D9CL77_BRACM|nr:unnamed protein product [Brassica rapa]
MPLVKRYHFLIPRIPPLHLPISSATKHADLLLFSHNLSSSGGEFYDARDELSTDSGTPSSVNNIETELRLSLLMESEKRRQAEETLEEMQVHWRRLRQQLAHVGLFLPLDPTSTQYSMNIADELRCQIEFTRFVSDSLDIELAKAEVEMEMTSELEAKKFEITQLSNRLHYSETVNQEMSQRNQEAIGCKTREEEEEKEEAEMDLGINCSKHHARWCSLGLPFRKFIETSALTNQMRLPSQILRRKKQKGATNPKMAASPNIPPTLSRYKFFSTSVVENPNFSPHHHNIDNRRRRRLIKSHLQAQNNTTAISYGAPRTELASSKKLWIRQQRSFSETEVEQGQLGDDEEELEDEASLLSLSVKPDRNMALLDDYEMEELGHSPPDTNHRSGYVAVVGMPNVGKSTLSNQMIGQKISIVTDKPQTTRHRILGICSSPDYQMILYDTPGVIEKKMHRLDTMMMKNVRDAAINADCVVILVDACKTPANIDQVLKEGLGDLEKRPPMLLVMNKKDLIKPGEIAKKLEWYEKFTDVDEVIPVSAKYGHGVEDVKEWILSKLPFGPPYYPKDIVSEHPERFFVAEIVREKIFMQYRNEVPYSCQVNVLSYKTRPAAKDFIQVEVVVDKNSQKIILIGKEGKALKTLATAARLDIEDFLQKKVFLEVEVKVKENWRQDEGLLKYYGYGGQIRAM